MRKPGGRVDYPGEFPMPRSWLLAVVAGGAVGALLVAPEAAPPVQAQEKDKKKLDVEGAVEKGLEYLKKTQAQDGHWEAQGGQYPTTMTALAGMCFLM